jgi:hypothetical protein
MAWQYEATEDQLFALAKMRELLGEKGFLICDVGPFFRRSIHDFLAYRPEQCNKFIVVRPTMSNRVSVTSSVQASLFHNLRKDINRMQKPLKARVCWTHRSLKFLAAFPVMWEQYFPEGELPRGRVKVA